MQYNDSNCNNRSNSYGKGDAHGSSYHSDANENNNTNHNNPAPDGTVITGHHPAESRDKALQRMIVSTEKALDQAPPGSLIIRHPKHSGGAPEYYQYLKTATGRKSTLNTSV